MKEKNKIFDKLINSIKETNKCSNAYILSGNDREYLKECALKLSKSIICINNNEKKNEIEHKIDENSYSELLFVSPQNEVIKKEEILNIINFFQKKSIISNKGVYIIEEAQYLNNYSANSLLKFLEEPPENVTAIFTTTNINLMIETIVSRCQIININNDKINKTIEEKIGISNNEFNYLLNFFVNFENCMFESIINIKKLILEKFSSKESLKKVIYFFLLMYNEILKYKLIEKNEYNLDVEKIKDIAEKNSVRQLIKKIRFSLTNLNKLNYNVNIQLFLKNYLIEIGEIKDDRCSGNKVFK